MASPIWAIEAKALDSTGDMIANSLAARLVQVQGALGATGANSHLPLFTGDLWYVDAAQPDDTGDGRSPETAKETIGAAIGVAAAGDAITVKSGTYTETGLDMNLDALELWCEIGVTIDPASGTALTVSGNACRIKGEHTISVAAGATGLLISGDECVIADSKILNGAIGVQVTGSGVILNECAVGFQTSIAYDLQGIQGRLFRCKTVGSGATIGYKISGGADTGVLESCTSTGRQTAGYYIETGSQDWTLLRCSSGAGDGSQIDVDNANVWSGYTFDDEVFHTTTFAGGGGGTDNLFQITGSVEIQFIYGNVETVLSVDVDDIYLDLWDGTVAVEITDNAGTDTNSADTGSLFVKTEDATAIITLLQSNQGRVHENTNFRKPLVPFILNQKKDTATYIRLTYSGVATSGAIHWHCRWEPLTEGAFVVAV